MWLARALLAGQPFCWVWIGMKQRRKTWIITGLISLTLLMIILLWGKRALNDTVQKAIEYSATEALGVNVTVGAVKLSLLDGVLALSDLRIANPPGYHNPTLLTLKRGTVVLKVSSLLEPTVKVTSMVLDTVDVVWEQKGLDNNLQQVIDHLPARNSDEGTGKTLRIETLDLNQATVQAELLPLPGQVKPLTLTLSPIHLTNLGREHPMDLRALARRVLSALVTRILAQGRKSFPIDLMKPLEKTARVGLQFFKDAGVLGENLLNPPEKKEGIKSRDSLKALKN